MLLSKQTGHERSNPSNTFARLICPVLPSPSPPPLPAPPPPPKKKKKKKKIHALTHNKTPQKRATHARGSSAQRPLRAGATSEASPSSEWQVYQIRLCVCHTPALGCPAPGSSWPITGLPPPPFPWAPGSCMKRESNFVRGCARSLRLLVWTEQADDVSRLSLVLWASTLIPSETPLPPPHPPKKKKTNKQPKTNPLLLRSLPCVYNCSFHSHKSLLSLPRVTL